MNTISDRKVEVEPLELGAFRSFIKSILNCVNFRTKSGLAKYLCSILLVLMFITPNSAAALSATDSSIIGMDRNSSTLPPNHQTVREWMNDHVPTSRDSLNQAYGADYTNSNSVLKAAPFELWYGIASDSTGKYLAAVGYYEGIYTSSNYGSTWSQTSAPNANWVSIASDSTGQYLAAVVPDGGIYTSSNNGSTWSQTSAPNTAYWQSIASDSTGQYLAAVVYGGNIYTSSDYGSNWSQTSAPSAAWNSIASDSTGKYLAAVAAGLGIYTSSNNGSTWSQTSAPSAAWNSIASDSTGKYLAAAVGGGGGGIYTSSNYGSIWSKTSAPSAQWVGIASDSTGQYLAAAVVYNGDIYTSSTYGSTWSQTSAPSNTWWQSIASDSTGQYLAAGVSGGGIYTSFDYGASWVSGTQFYSPSPTRHPTDRPTSMPSCAPGEGTMSGDRIHCVPCPAGYYPEDEEYCVACGEGTYTSSSGSRECDVCPGYSYPPVSKAAMSCDGACVCFHNLQKALLLASIALVYVSCWRLAGESSVAIAINMILPMIDHTTDVLYFVTTPFYSIVLCLLSLCCVMGPTVMFAYYLLQDGASPAVFHPYTILMLSQEKGNPLLYGKPVSLSLDKHDTPLRFIWWVVLWILLLILQCGSVALALLYYLLYPLFLVCWFLLGTFLFATRTIAVGKVRMLWYNVWTNDSNWFNDGVMGDIDTEVLNQCLFAGFVLETIPHFFVQVSNNVLIGNWSIFTAISAASSLYMMLSGVWQFIYYRYWRNTPLHEVPVHGVLPIELKALQFAKVKPSVGARHRPVNRNSPDMKANVMYANLEGGTNGWSERRVELVNYEELDMEHIIAALSEEVFKLLLDTNNHNDSAVTSSKMKEMGITSAAAVATTLLDEYDRCFIAVGLKKSAFVTFNSLIKQLQLQVEKQQQEQL